MPGIFSAEYFRFLFRQDRGTVDRRTWAVATAAIVGVWILVFAIEQAINRAGALARVGVVSLFVLVTMLLAACYYFVSAKRLRDRGRAPALALVLPAVGFADAVLNFVRPVQESIVTQVVTLLADAVLIGVAIWNLVELGLMPGRPAGGPPR